MSVAEPGPAPMQLGPRELFLPNCSEHSKSMGSGSTEKRLCDGSHDTTSSRGPCPMHTAGTTRLVDGTTRCISGHWAKESSPLAGPAVSTMSVYGLSESPNEHADRGAYAIRRPSHFSPHLTGAWLKETQFTTSSPLGGIILLCH